MALGGNGFGGLSTTTCTMGIQRQQPAVPVVVAFSWSRSPNLSEHVLSRRRGRIGTEMV